MLKKIEVYINWGYDNIPVALKQESSNSLILLYPEVNHRGHPKTYLEIQNEIDSWLRCLFDANKNNSLHELRIFTTSEHLIRRIERRIAEGAKAEVTYYFPNGSIASVLPSGAIQANDDCPEEIWNELAEDQCAINEIWKNREKNKKSSEFLACEKKLAADSAALLALQPNFDEEGSIPPAREVVDWASEYLLFLFECWDDCFPLPDLSVGPEDSVDVTF